MKISIIIPAFNEAQLLPATLAATTEAAQVLGQQGWEWELIVCDNNSTDATASLARAGGAQVVSEPINQIGRARDTGARAAKGEWLIFIDADSLPDADLFGDLATAIKSNRYIGGGSTVRLPSDTPTSAKFYAAGWNRWSRLVGWAAGSCVWVSTAAFKQVGGFGNEVYAGEEIGLSRRLKCLGKKQGLGFFILNQHPLLTSDRKVRLYSNWEVIRLLLKMVLTLGRARTNQADCHLWYDGRR